MHQKLAVPNYLSLHVQLQGDKISIRLFCEIITSTGGNGDTRGCSSSGRALA